MNIITNLITGDTIEFECNAGENISNWKIKCVIQDSKYSIKKATANAGGNDNQIKITNASSGIFSIYIDAGETSQFETVKESNIEIQVETPSGKIYTVYQNKIKFNKALIT